MFFFVLLSITSSAQSQSLPRIEYQSKIFYGLTTDELYRMIDSILSYKSLQQHTDSLIKYDIKLEKKLSIAKSEISDFKQLTDSLRADKSDLEAQKLNLLTVVGERDRTIKKKDIQIGVLRLGGWVKFLIGGAAGWLAFDYLHR